MRKAAFITVLVAIVGLLILFFRQWHEARELRAKAVAIRKTIQSMERWETRTIRSGSGRERGNGVETSEPAILADGNINWKRYLEVMESTELMGIGDLRDKRLVEARLKEMSFNELIDALHLSKQADMTMAARYMIEKSFIWLLSEKDPEATLNAFGNELSGRYQGELGQVFGKLARADIRAAIAWLDARIAEGKMESKSLSGMSHTNDPIRSMYEEALLEFLMPKDMGAASARLSGMPADLRFRVLHNLNINGLTDAQAGSIAQTIKETLPADAQAKVFSRHSIGQLSMKDPSHLSRVSEFIGRIDAGPQVVNACVEQAVAKRLEGDSTVYVDDLRKLHGWAAGHLSKADADVVLGSAVSRSIFSEGMPDNTGLVLEYYRSGGGEGFLESVILNAEHLTDDQTERLLREIPDDARRQEIRGARLEKFPRSDLNSLIR